MNPWPVILALYRRNRSTIFLFTVLVACAVALGVAITSQERALRSGSARATDKFDLMVAAPGSQTDLLMSVVFLRPVSVGLMLPGDVARVLGDDRAEWAAPIAFGDSFDGRSIIGTTEDFVRHISGGLTEGRLFASDEEAVVGAAVPIEVGSGFVPVHGHGPEAVLAEDGHGYTIQVIGRMKPTRTPWDNAIVVPVELVWNVHGLPRGHASGDERVGPPFLSGTIPGVPAVVMKPDSVAAAYGLRNEYRTVSTTAFFPAEILVQLYEVLGNVGGMMRFLAVASQALVVAATFAGVLAMMELYRAELALLRALGASRSYIFIVVWVYVVLFVFIGAIIGMLLGAIVAKVISMAFTANTGIAMTATIGRTEVLLAAGLVAFSSLLALLPAWLIYRRPVLDSLQ